jgi:ABC-type multidrug transport system ATPase subunit
VKYFGAEEREARRYDASMRGYEKAATETAVSLSWLNLGQAAIITAGLVAVMVMAARGVQAGTLTVGDFVMVNAYMIQITLPLNFLGTVYREIRQSLIDMDAMFDLLEQPAEIKDKPGAKPLVVTGGGIEFRDVSFAYETERAILQGLTLTVEPGRTVAVVGPSGSGKSTIGRLLFRFYDVTSGAVLIDGQDLRDVTQESLRAAIGMVPQDTVLFNETIYYNIAYGRPEATAAEVEAAARAASIHDFILSLPQGYDAVVGERGLKLSGGEKQRVGIARTLLKDPPILLLDEATSALDTGTEREIQESLKAMGEGRSVIVIAHRLSTVVDADRIVVLEAGRWSSRAPTRRCSPGAGDMRGCGTASNRSRTRTSCRPRRTRPEGRSPGVRWVPGREKSVQIWTLFKLLIMLTNSVYCFERQTRSRLRLLLGLLAARGPAPPGSNALASRRPARPPRPPRTATWDRTWRQGGRTVYPRAVPGRARLSESDSFISEVSEEVRRERLYRTLRRYGWLIAAALLLVVGGAAWHEWSEARTEAAAEAQGDALRAALATPEPAARAEALAALAAGGTAPVVRIAEAGARLAAGDGAGAAASLEAVAADGGTPELYRALAALQRVMVLGPQLDAGERLAALDGLAAEGAPFRPLALEQRALLRLETGETAAALADLQAILDAPTAPEGLRGRARQLIVAAGGEAPAADAPASGG